MKDGLGGDVSERQHRPYPIELNAIVIDGRMQIRWTFTPARHPEAVIGRLAELFVERLRDLVEHCSDSAGGFTLSDFDLINL